MNVIRPTPSRRYFNYYGMVESTKKLAHTFENRVLLFGHGKPVNNMQWVK